MGVARSQLDEMPTRVNLHPSTSGTSAQRISMDRVKTQCCLRVGEQLHFATRRLVEAMHGF
jgi:hypothetical protein